jgi:hypothetical protein
MSIRFFDGLIYEGVNHKNKIYIYFNSEVVRTLNNIVTPVDTLAINIVGVLK